MIPGAGGGGGVENEFLFLNQPPPPVSAGIIGGYGIDTSHVKIEKFHLKKIRSPRKNRPKTKPACKISSLYLLKLFD